MSLSFLPPDQSRRTVNEWITTSLWETRDLYLLITTSWWRLLVLFFFFGFFARTRRDFEDEHDDEWMTGRPEFRFYTVRSIAFTGFLFSDYWKVPRARAVNRKWSSPRDWRIHKHAGSEQKRAYTLRLCHDDDSSRESIIRSGRGIKNKITIIRAYNNSYYMRAQCQSVR